MRQGTIFGGVSSGDSRKPRPAESVVGWITWTCVTMLACVHTPLLAQEPTGVQPLLSIHSSDLHAQLPPETHLLFDAAAIERFLESLDGRPPDWATIYGRGHHDPDLDERLFSLNRERDEQREAKDARHRRIAFLWSGQLSGVDAGTEGFRVALGPIFTTTNWGMVRFKYEGLSGNLVALPTTYQRNLLLPRIQQGHSLDIDVIMTGTLIPTESIVYDFSHDQEGMGLIMPVVRLEHILYVLQPER